MIKEIFGAKMKSQKAHEAFETLGVITQRLETVVFIRLTKVRTATVLEAV